MGSGRVHEHGCGGLCLCSAMCRWGLCVDARGVNCVGHTQAGTAVMCMSMGAVVYAC